MANNNVENAELVVDSWCKTKGGEEVKFKFAWTIERFSTRSEENGESFCSNMFHIQGPDDLKCDWRLELFPKGEDQDARNFLSIFAKPFNNQNHRVLGKSKPRLDRIETACLPLRLSIFSRQ